ncbi:MAG: hypothetical protein ABI765_12865 [Gemmatimonadota bacterium]
MLRIAALAGAGLLGSIHGVAAQHAKPDSAFSALQQRGEHYMGVDQTTSTHTFQDLPDGGRIVLVRDSTDSAGVAMIRMHLNHIARAFGAGNFAIPMLVHDTTVPGTAVMSRKHDAIRYRFSELPGGGQIQITTADPEALAAVHEFLAFQRADHRIANH